MILLTPTPEDIALQTIAVNLDGTPKLDVVSGQVRIYFILDTDEVTFLPSTDLENISGTSLWRYIWSPGISLVARQYVAEYTLIDADSKTSVISEDLIVRDSNSLGSAPTSVKVLTSGSNTNAAKALEDAYSAWIDSMEDDIEILRIVQSESSINQVSHVTMTIFYRTY